MDKRTELIKILSRNADEPQNTVDAIIDLFKETPQNRALYLYEKGWGKKEVEEVLINEFELSEYDAIVQIDSARKIYEETILNNNK